MDNEQFGGRTDDDLFSDDFEPVLPEDEIVTITNEFAAQTLVPDPPSAAAATSQAPAAPAAASHPPTTAQRTQQAAPTHAALQGQAPPKSLAQSRHNRPEKPSKPAGNKQNNQHNHSHNHSKHSKSHPSADVAALTATPAPTQEHAQVSEQTQAQAPAEPQAQTSSSAPPSAPTEPAAMAIKDKEKTQEGPAKTPSASAIGAARLGSGANPRTKLTETELAAKMEQMRILAAEKTRRFEQAQRDESEHAVAYAKGMEEARKRRAEEATKRRAADEDRRRLEEERAKNRERKLHAMGQKEGGWDEGKDERIQEEERKVYRGANGGVRGTKSNVGGGLSGSRFATPAAVAGGDGERREGGGYGGEREDRGFRGRGGGRGRGGRGGGRGGRALFDADGDRDADRHTEQQQKNWPRGQAAGAQKNKPILEPEAFPALPGSSAPKKIDVKTTMPALPSFNNSNAMLSPLIGKWADEVAAMDEKPPADS
ncbi:hypothetical protein B0T19DRAFT_111428 [Cercophora scortea]|uniref:Uncharacterized protein n=1 Tax=Cercophora scortea TaxID=314031 RepID=A0AAE0MIY8_9PEZI|nr:hypothetical protein B0T19DRAFT_111428 [Cercophora scortea]